MTGSKNGEKSAGGAVVRLRRVRQCPICGEDTVSAYYPFCSKRCADIDLNRWLSGAYVIPGREDDEDAGDGDHDNGES